MGEMERLSEGVRFNAALTSILVILRGVSLMYEGSPKVMQVFDLRVGRLLVLFAARSISFHSYIQ